MKLFGKVFLSLLAFIAIDKALLYLVSVVVFGEQPLSHTFWIDVGLGAGFWSLTELFFMIVF